MNLQDLIANGNVQQITAFLDNLSHVQRRDETRTLNRAQQRRLYQMCTDNPGLALEDFVPATIAARTEVIHAGRNTLPLPGKIKLFEKRFCRTSQAGVLAGYNHGVTTALIGPGYFLAKSTAGNSAWESRGSVVVDYFEVPNTEVVDGWPQVVPNHKGLQVLVYHKTRDFMRKVSEHVTIGAAYKKEKSLDHYFVLCRMDS